MKKILALAMILLLLSGCMGGGSEIVLPERQPVTPPVVTPEPQPQVQDIYLTVGGTLLGMRSAQGVWQQAGEIPQGLSGWTVFGETVTRSETLPAGLPAGTLAVSGEGARRLELQGSTAWNPASDLLYALVRSLTATEPLIDQPEVTLLGAGDLLGDGSLTRLLWVRSGYSLLVLERDGAYSALPDCTEFLGAYTLEGQTLLLCGTETGCRLLTWNGTEWTVVLPV